MEIRNYQQGDELKILELFEIVFGKKMTLEYWTWRFLNNPFSRDMLIHLMWEDEKLIGQYALSPVRMRIDGENKMAALAMSLMTHPDYQGKGVFAKLGNSLHDEIKSKAKYHMIFAFPNNKTHSHYGFVKNLGWKDISIIPMMSVRSTDLRLKVGEKTNYSVLRSFENLTHKIYQFDKSVRIDFSPDYLQWRYIDNPSVDYKIIELDNKKGLGVYKIIPSFSGDGSFEVDLMEVVFGKDPQFLSDIINSIIDHEQGKEIHGFNIWKSIFSADQIWYEKVGFKISPPLNYLSYLEFEDSDSVSDFRNWDIGMGYSDVF